MLDAVRRYLGFGLGGADVDAAVGGGASVGGADVGGGAGRPDGGGAPVPTDSGERGPRTRWQRWRRPIGEWAVVVAGFGGLFGIYVLGTEVGEQEARAASQTFREAPVTSPEQVADLLSRYGLPCDEVLVDNGSTTFTRQSYVCPVLEQRFELDFVAEGWHVFRSLEMLGAGIACIPVAGTTFDGWWAVWRDDWMVILHDEEVAEGLGRIPGAVVSSGRCERGSTGVAQ